MNAGAILTPPGARGGSPAGAVTRDFLLVQSQGEPAPNGKLASSLRWHEALGGSANTWTSPRLGCHLWGPTPSIATIRRDGTEWQVACVLTGAPAGFGSLDPEALQAKLIAVYETEGLEALARLEGSFCGVLLDERAGAFLFTDRFGCRKAFFVRDGGAGYASSRAVVLARGLGLDIDPAGAACCTMIGHTIGRRTLFSGCEAVMPATAVELSSGREQTYWQISRYLAERPRDAAATADLRERFNAAVTAFVRAQQVPALNMTGGFDTRAVLSASLLADRLLIGVTSGRQEQRTVDAVVAAAGIEHCYFPYTDGAGSEGDTAFALLTDGECEAGAGAALLDYWQRVGGLARSGCLHGGFGEAWRSYHYKFLWPPARSVAREPIGFLTSALLRPRTHLLSALRKDLRGQIRDLLATDVRALWALVDDADGRLAAMDAFYLLERQRGLTRVASAADLWNPAYAPFGHSLFCEAACGYLGVQNRGETLHRDIIFANAPRLAALGRHEGGTCLPMGPAVNAALQAGATARHLAGGLLGARLRRFLQPVGLPSRELTVDFGSFDGSPVFDVAGLRRAASQHSHDPGLGSVAAIIAATTADCPPPLFGSPTAERPFSIRTNEAAMSARA